MQHPRHASLVLDYPFRFRPEVHDEHSILAEYDTIQILQKNRSDVRLPQVIALVAIFYHLGIQVDHENVICVNMHALVANRELELSSVFVLYQIQFSVSDVQLALPIDQEHWLL